MAMYSERPPRVLRKMLMAKNASSGCLAMPEDDGSTCELPVKDDIRLQVETALAEIRLVNLPVPRSEFLDLRVVGGWCVSDARSIICPRIGQDEDVVWLDASDYL